MHGSNGSRHTQKKRNKIFHKYNKNKAAAKNGGIFFAFFQTEKTEGTDPYSKIAQPCFKNCLAILGTKVTDSTGCLCTNDFAQEAIF